KLADLSTYRPVQICPTTSPLTAGPNDGSRPDDGSYLIGDGPGFIEQMRKERIVCRDHDFDDSGSDDY
ncbi:MAG: hypothetical protein ACOYBW_10705, partial [Fluviibacter phosphoraccumulans]